MVEYIVVITALLGVYVSTPLMDEMANLETAMNNKNKGYAYAISLSDYLDSEDINDLISYYPEAEEQYNKLQDAYDEFETFFSNDLPSGLSLDGVTDIIDIDINDIYDALF
ncbi:MAG: hypothetical protein OQL19_00440 [Gammaproteobacteria bacterium]|nr:hypothetical protein [Gammaproteobacteria bacterium]